MSILSLWTFMLAAHIDEMESSDERVKTFFEVMSLFSNDDRSRFLRFVTGRKRLPCPLYISPYKRYVISGYSLVQLFINKLLSTFSSFKVRQWIVCPNLPPVLTPSTCRDTASTYQSGCWISLANQSPVILINSCFI